VDSTSRVRLVLKKFSLGAEKALDKIQFLDQFQPVPQKKKGR